LTEEKKEKYSEFKHLFNEIEKMLRANNLDKVQSKLKQLNKDHKDYPPLLVLWADYYAAKGDLKRAEKEYIKALDIDNTFKPAYFQLAVFYDRYTKQYDRVVEVFWAGIHNSGDPLLFYHYLEIFYTNMGDSAKAIEIVRTLEKEYADKGEFLYKQGEAAFTLGLQVDAVDYLRQALAKGYIGERHYIYMADCLVSFGGYDYSLEMLKKAIHADPNEYELFGRLHALLAQKIGSWNEDLITAINLRQAYRSDAVKEKVNLAYFISEKSHTYYNDLLNKFIKTDYDDLSLDYTAFCEIYKHILLEQPGFVHKRVKLREGFIASLQNLRQQSDKDSINVQEGWQAYLDEDYEKAAYLFYSAEKRKDKIADYLYKSAIEGFNLAKAHTTEQASEHLTDIQSKDSSNSTSSLTLPDESASKTGRDLVKLAADKKLFKRKGLEQSVFKMAENLAYGLKKSMILTGPPGVGKTEAVNQLAHYVKSNDRPIELKDFKIIQTSTSEILAGAKYIGIWESRLENFCNRCGWHKRTVIYLEDLANIIGAGSVEGGTSTFIDVLMPLIDQQKIVVIGEMETIQAEKFLWKNPRLARLLTEVRIEEPNSEEISEILKDEIKLSHISKQAAFTSDSLDEITHLTESFLPYQALPGKAIDLIASILQLYHDPKSKKRIDVTPKLVQNAFSEITGMPEFIIDKTQRIDIAKADAYFKERVLGQETAIESVLNTITTFKSRLNDQHKPVRSYLFVGPTGVGKTETAKVLSGYLFSSQERIVRLNMSEYNEWSSVTKLIGEHYGREKASYFIDSIRQTPFAVVLLDEIEKAHPDVLNILLQLLDEGMISDGEGKPAYFRSAIIIMTSNLGSKRYSKETIGFGKNKDVSDVTNAVLADVKDFFSPEIYNRFDEVICFKPLATDVVDIIVNREIGKVLERKGAINLGATVEVDPLVKEYIKELGYDPRYGARHIKRIVERAVASPLGRLVATTEVALEDQVRINLHDGKPVADLIIGNQAALKNIEELTVNTRQEIEIPDKGVAKIVEALRYRIAKLKKMFNYDDVISEKDDLQKLMAKPSFWDKPEKAKLTLKRFAEVNRTTERMHRWDRSFEKLKTSQELVQELSHPAEKFRSHNELVSLLKDLESAEMEILLEGKYDFSDAFIIVNSGGDDGHLKWLLETVKVYTDWARRRGYSYKVFGEDFDKRRKERSIYLYITGMNAFGLLKNERGIHRKIVTSKSGDKVKKSTFECMVYILADIQSMDNKAFSRLKVDVKKLKKTTKGQKLRWLSRRVSLEDKVSGTKLEFSAESSLDKDGDLPGDLFLSYLHFDQKKLAKRSESKNIYGSLVRTYQTGAGSQIVDHKTKIVINKVKDYLSGKIDSLLLERII